MLLLFCSQVLGTCQWIPTAQVNGISSTENGLILKTFSNCSPWISSGWCNWHWTNAERMRNPRNRSGFGEVKETQGSSEGKCIHPDQLMHRSIIWDWFNDLWKANHWKFFFESHDLFSFSFFSPIFILLQKHAILLQSQSWNQRNITIWVGIKCVKSHLKQKCKFDCISEKKKKTTTNQTNNNRKKHLSPPQEILWRENWHLLCLAGLLHKYVDCGCCCRSWLFPVRMPDKGQLHVEVPDQPWFNITCNFGFVWTQGDGIGFARHCLMTEAKSKGLRTTAMVDLKGKA